MFSSCHPKLILLWCTYGLLILIIVRTQSFPAILLLLLGVSRNLLNYSCRAIRGLSGCFANIAQQHAAQGQTAGANLAHSATTSLTYIIDKAKVKPQLFEALLHDIESSLKGLRESRPDLNTQVKREIIERGILLQATIPEEYSGAVERMVLSRNWEKNGEKSGVTLAKESDLYYSDYTLLEFLTNRSRTSERFVDAFSKLLINGNEDRHVLKDADIDFMPLDPERPSKRKTRSRTCVRCCARTEDLISRKQRVGWLTAVKRHCFCGSFWMITI